LPAYNAAGSIQTMPNFVGLFEFDAENEIYFPIKTLKPT